MTPTLLAFLPNMGPVELVVVAAFSLVPWGIAAWALVDAGRRPDQAWRSIGRDRLTWVLGIVLAALFCGPFSLVVSVVYLAAVRPELNSQKPPLA